MTVRLTGDPRAPSAARAYVADRLSGARDQVWVGDVVLVVSELVTNSVRAGASAIEVALDVTEARVALVVDDDATGWPEATTAADDDTTGRGLRIVEQLADEWRTASRPRGKRVVATWAVRAFEPERVTGRG